MRHNKLILLLFTSALLLTNVNAQSVKTQKKDSTAKQKKVNIVGQDSVSKKNSERDQNRKRTHRKNINDNKKTKK